ncbi:MAG: hypothetical protein RL885_03385 [Planctomycetota bacterium]
MLRTSVRGETRLATRSILWLTLILTALSGTARGRGPLADPFAVAIQVGLPSVQVEPERVHSERLRGRLEGGFAIEARRRVEGLSADRSGMRLSLGAWGQSRAPEPGLVWLALDECDPRPDVPSIGDREPTEKKLSLAEAAFRISRSKALLSRRGTAAGKGRFVPKTWRLDR